MRLLHVVPTYLPATRYGGPIHSVHGLCRGLVELGHEVDVLTTNVDGPYDSDVPLEHAVELDGVSVTYFASKRGRRLYFAPRLKAALQARIAGYDCVHLHSVFLWPTNAAASVARAAGVPYVLSPRGMLVPELVQEKSRWLKSAWLTLVESRTLAGAAHVHLTSRRELLDAQRMPLPIPAPRVVPNGVRGPADGWQERVSTRAGAIAERKPFVLYLGRLSWKKGLPRTIEALAGSDVRLVICGPDDEGMTPQLRALAERTGVAARVAIEEAVDGADKWALLQAARAIVLASDNENFGNVVPEAMWMGTPVVVSEQTGARDVVEQAGAGLVCARDPSALRDALGSLWRDAALCARMGQAGQRFAREHLSWPFVARQMQACYASAIERAASSEVGP
jgi:glycosyltransferase involved in cell wall biosynthesis